MNALRRNSGKDQTGAARSGVFRSILDAYPSIVLILDEAMVVRDLNEAARQFSAHFGPILGAPKGGEVLRCVNALRSTTGCGTTAACRSCPIRGAAGEAFAGGKAVRRSATMTFLHGTTPKETYASITATRFRFRHEWYVILVIEDLSAIVELQRMIPICSVCKKVRTEHDAWQRVERYFHEHWNLRFSHGYCPECFEVEREKLRRLIAQSPPTEDERFRPIDRG